MKELDKITSNLALTASEMPMIIELSASYYRKDSRT